MSTKHTQMNNKQSWPIIQAMIRCGLANKPTEAFKHQVKRYQREFAKDSREYISIEEMLNAEPEDTFTIVQSAPPSDYVNFNTGEDIIIG